MSIVSGASKAHYHNTNTTAALAALETPHYEDFDIEYLGRNRFAWLGNGFDVREEDGVSLTSQPGYFCPHRELVTNVVHTMQRDLTWYYGLLDGLDKQLRKFSL